MMAIVADNTLVYFLMEKANVLFSDFTIDHVVAFDYEGHFNLVIYILENKNFVCFIAKK